MDLVVVVLVGQVVHVGPNVNVLVHLIFGHRVKDPITRNLFHQAGDRIERRGGTGGAAVHKIRATAQAETPRHLEGVPGAEGVSGNVGQLSAYGEWENQRACDNSVQISVAGQNFPAASYVSVGLYLDPAHPLAAG